MSIIRLLPKNDIPKSFKIRVDQGQQSTDKRSRRVERNLQKMLTTLCPLLAILLSTHAAVMSPNIDTTASSRRPSLSAASSSVSPVPSVPTSSASSFKPPVASVTIPKVPVKSKGFSAGANPKRLAVERFKFFISDFFTDAQLSKAIDVAAVGMHKGKPLEDILEDVYTRIRKVLSTQQISDLARAQKGLLSELDEKSVKLLRSRVRRMIVYSFDPAAEQIHKFATKPSMAFALIAETINERFISSVKGLIRDVLTTQEYDAFRKYYSPKIFKLDVAKTTDELKEKTSDARGQ